MSASSSVRLSDRKQLKKRRNKEYSSDNVLDSPNFERNPKQAMSASQQNRVIDWLSATVLTLWTCYIRLWKISQPSSVVFDEVHFGGFASKYINKKFFMDVHPPLAKLLITWSAQTVGFDGQFDFKEIGKDYLYSKVPYVPIRAFCALYGVMLVPIAYWTMRGVGFSVATATLTALMICYENGLITNNRLILLDSILLYFTAFTILVWINFRNQSKNSFSAWWWFWLLITGTGLGLTVSCKWVGLFTIATIGIAVLKDLWDIWGDCKTTVSRFVQHFMARAVCLIGVPCIIYMACFQIHFAMLPLSGGGSSFMSPEFQSSLQGINFPKTTPADIVYGAKIDIRHMATQGGYLHSHKHDYPGGSEQQQVTLYSYVDDNNWWVINKADTDTVNDLEYVRNGDIVRLTHLSTHKRLHTHDIRPTTNGEKYQYEVSAYGFKGFDGDSNDDWRVEIMPNSDPVANDRLRARRSQFRLISVTQSCALFSRKYKLPDWGFSQQEVTCMKDANYPKTIWRIESTQSELLPNETEHTEYEHERFLTKFIELNKVMWNVNRDLSSSHSYGSRPKDWPTLERGISFWSKGQLKVYLLGNPLVYWVSLACILSYALIKPTLFIASKRQVHIPYFSDLDSDWATKYDAAAGFFFVSWALHYFPFNLMHRQLFLHHYMPSLYMSTLLAGVFFELLTRVLSTRIRWSLVAICVFAVVYVYHIFIPITYAEPWTKEKCLQASWRSKWDFNCKWFENPLYSSVTSTSASDSEQEAADLLKNEQDQDSLTSK